MKLTVVYVGDDIAVYLNVSQVCAFDPQVDDEGQREQLQVVAKNLGRILNVKVAEIHLPEPKADVQWSWNDIEKWLRVSIRDRGPEGSPELICCSTMRDWRLREGTPESDISPSHNETYKLEIAKSPFAEQIYFRVVPVDIDEASFEDPIDRGIAGCIEIRNGLPGISVGTDENNLYTHLEAVPLQGLFLHTDNGIKSRAGLFVSETHNSSQFKGTYLYGKDQRPEDGLNKTREAIAENRLLKLVSLRKIDGAEWHHSGDNLTIEVSDTLGIFNASTFSVGFAEDSAVVQFETIQ